MQQIERYGVIALVFLLVTIVAVSFWGDSKSPGFWSRLTGRGAKKDAVATQTLENPGTTASNATSADAPPVATGERAIQTELPMSSTTPSPVTPLEAAPAMANGTTHSVTPNTANGAAPTVAVTHPTPQPSNAAPMIPAATPRGSSVVALNANQPYRPSLVSTASAPVASRAPAAVAAQAPAREHAAGTSEYVVQKGDSLMHIAAKTLGSKSRWTEIRDLNHGLDPRSLKVGMKISVPAAAGSSKAGSPTASPMPEHKPAVAPASHGAKSSSNSTDTYVVKKGDTMKSIAEQLLGDRERWKSIAAANPKIDPHHISVGASLKIPGGHVAAARTETPREPVLAAATRSDLPSGRPHVR